MKKITLLKSMLLLCALVAGSSSVWADDTYYVKVSSASELVDGGTYIIGDVVSSTAYAFVAVNDKSKGTTVSAGLSVIGNSIKVASDAETKPCEFILNATSTANVYTLKISGGNYLGYNSGTNYQTVATLPTGSGLTKYQWTITYNSTYSCFTMVNVNSTSRVMLRKNNASPQVYGPYSDSNMGNADYNVATIYKKCSAKFAAGKTLVSFSCASNAIDLAHLPSGLYAYKVSAANATSVTLTEVTEAVTANTGLILKGTAGETYNIPTVASGTDISTSNLLVASNGTSNVTSAYVLSGGKFHPVQAAGIIIPAGKAYLPAGLLNAHELDIEFDNGDVTGIKAVEAQKAFDGAFYNLAGQRVAQPTKGLYIVNGKKVIIK